MMSIQFDYCNVFNLATVHLYLW